MLYSLDGLAPRVHPSAFVAPTAVLIGDVTVEANASIWFNTVLRGDAGPIVIGEGTNVQDGAVLHEETIVGKNCVLAHQVLVHHATVGDGVMIGNGALVFGDVKVGDEAIIGAGAVLVGPAVVEARTVWLGVPAKLRGEADERQIRATRSAMDFYLKNAVRYLKSLKPVE